MPLNKNALVRYKTIHKCLSTGKRFDIYDLIDACSAALSVDCGSKQSISERTIRDDLRVMRDQSILEFDAPIIVENGKYFYKDPNYKIDSKLISGDSLLREIHKRLIIVRRDVSHPELDYVIRKLEEIADRYERRSFNPSKQTPGLMSFIIKSEPEPIYVTWGEIFKLITLNI